MSQITTHILDTSSGTPAADVQVKLLQDVEGGWHQLAWDITDNDGRIGHWLEDQVLEAGHYKLVFHTAAYFAKQDTVTFYPYVEIVFTIAEDGEHYHVPLLLNPFGYTTYRGS